VVDFVVRPPDGPELRAYGLAKCHAAYKLSDVSEANYGQLVKEVVQHCGLI
jgi:hypothetical protein